MMVGQTSNGEHPTPKLRQSPRSFLSILPVVSLSARPFYLLCGQLLNPVENVTTQSENPFAKLILEQQIAIIPSFTLESGVTLYNLPVAYTTRGRLSENRDNALVICHALSGSADVADWWGPLLGGQGQAFDITRFLVVCLNSLGSPYGSASPVTSKNGDSNLERYGPEFPLTTIRDDVK
jgi:homoserine O-acetyltransferase